MTKPEGTSRGVVTAEQLSEHSMQQSDAMRNRSGNVDGADALTCFLYLLARDSMPVGAIEGMIDKSRYKHDGDPVFLHQYSNGWLAQWAEDAAKRLSDADDSGAK